MYIPRDEAVKRIKAALLRKTGKQWLVHGGRGTAWGWITVEAPKARRVALEMNPAYLSSYETPGMDRDIEVIRGDGNNYYTGKADCKILAKAFGLSRPVHHQGLHISPDECEFYVLRAEA